MIRRTFWLTVGAAAGIMGYRRVSAVGRRLSGTLSGGGTHNVAGLARETVRFTRDVREGMELYMARHPAPPGRTLGTLDTTDHDPRPKDGR